jgi:hypothetical protein
MYPTSNGTVLVWSNIAIKKISIAKGKRRENKAKYIS